MKIQRRHLIRGLSLGLAGVAFSRVWAVMPHADRDRALGLLLGSFLGDAMGGPLEFANEETRAGHVVGARQWPDTRRLTQASIRTIAQQAKLMSYEEVRPDTAPYGQWRTKAPAGTITDDSRWKIILVRALRKANLEKTALQQSHLARAICDFQPRTSQAPNEATKQLVEEGLREYRYAAHWILGERDPKLALPLERLWAGIPNCSGQMTFLPLAISHAGDPESAYLRAYEINFVDSAGAKDICSAMVASLASVLGEDSSSHSHAQRWETVNQTLRSLDPLRLKQVPFAGRPLDKWLDLVDEIVEQADGRPAVAYRLLETQAKPVYYWDAHFTLVVSLTLLKLSRYDAMCALALAIDFGHDTDSYAQLIGAFAGAVYGTDVFPVAMRETVSNQLQEDFDEDLDDWVSLLTTSSTEQE